MADNVGHKIMGNDRAEGGEQSHATIHPSDSPDAPLTNPHHLILSGADTSSGGKELAMMDPDPSYPRLPLLAKLDPRRAEFRNDYPSDIPMVDFAGSQPAYSDPLATICICGSYRDRRGRRLPDRTLLARRRPGTPGHLGDRRAGGCAGGRARSDPANHPARGQTAGRPRRAVRPTRRVELIAGGTGARANIVGAAVLDCPGHVAAVT